MNRIYIAIAVVFGLLALGYAEDSNREKNIYRSKSNVESTDGLFTSTWGKVVSGLKHIGSNHGQPRSHGYHEVGGYEEEDDGSSGLASLISILALLLGGLALLASLLGPLLGILGANNNNNGLGNVINGGTIPVLPANANLAGRRRRDLHSQNPFGFFNTLAEIDDALAKYDEISSECKKELACKIMNEETKDISSITKKFIVIYRTLKSADFTQMVKSPQEFIRNLMIKVSPMDCKSIKESKCHFD